MNNYNFVIFQSPKLLMSLKNESKPLWGKMLPQQMVEHLSLRFKYAAKKIIAKPFMTQERMAFYKAKFFNGSMIIKKEFTAKGLIPPDQVSGFRFHNLEEAVSVYKTSLQEFDNFFKASPIALTYHPFFGYLSYDEWFFYHSLHIQHHFYQFQLIDKLGNPITQVENSAI